MGLFRRALSSQLSKYKKRKNISLDGTVGGMSPGSAGPRHYAQAQDGWLGMRPASGQHSIYDAPAHYQHPNQDYREPPEWFVGVPKRGTPPLRLGPVPRGPRPPRPKYLLMDDDVMADAMQQLPDDEAFDEWDVPDDFGYPVVMDEGDSMIVHSSEGLPMLEDEELATEMTGELVPMSMEEHPWFGESEMTQDFFESAMAEAMGRDDLTDAIQDDSASMVGYEDSPYGTPFDEYDSELAPYAEAQMQAGFSEGYADDMDFDSQPEFGYAFDGAEMMQDAFDEPMSDLEAMVHEAMPEPEEPMQDMMEAAPYEQPMPEDDMMMDPWQMPGGFGPMGPMPFQ